MAVRMKRVKWGMTIWPPKPPFVADEHSFGGRSAARQLRTPGWAWPGGQTVGDGTFVMMARMTGTRQLDGQTLATTLTTVLVRTPAEGG
jgi:hypothetical protein